MKTFLENHSTLFYIAIVLFAIFTILAIFLIAVGNKVDELEAEKLRELNKPKKITSNFHGKKRFTKAPTDKKVIKLTHKF